jgi:hypothetical protein
VIDSVSFPETRRRSAGNSYTALLLLLHPVHRRRTLVHFADFVRYACVIKDTFGRGCLAASMWAMMPIFLNLLKSCLAIALLVFGFGSWVFDKGQSRRRKTTLTICNAQTPYLRPPYGACLPFS